MSAKKWKEEQLRVRRILLNDVVYFDNMRAADLALRTGRISNQIYRTVLNWNQRSALRRYQHNQERQTV